MGIVYSKTIYIFANEPNNNIMANYCSNYASIDGDMASIKLILSIVELAEDDAGIFELLTNKRCGLDENGWDYNVLNFGCRSQIDKFDFLEGVNLEDNEDGTARLNLGFTTPWAPPLEFFLSLAQIYNVTMSVEAEESGNDYFFYGEIVDGDWAIFDEMDYGVGVYKHQQDYFWDGYIQSEIEWMVEEDFDEEKVRAKFYFVGETDMADILELFYVSLNEQLKQTENEN